MRSRAWGSGALTATRAEEGSALVRPTRNSSTSNWPPSSTTRSKTFLRMSESIRCPSRRTVSWTIIDPPSELRKGQTLLRLVFALLVGVGRLADLVALEEEHLRDPFPGVDPGGQGQVVDWLHSNEALCHHRVPEKVRVGDAAQGLVSQARRHLAGEGAGDALARLRALDPHLTERAALGAAGLAESVPGLRR